jgi:carbonic anhydrase
MRIELGQGVISMTQHESQFLISADEALQLLIEGNERFQRGEVRISQFSTEVLGELAKGQKPFATILGCSDSRVSPEIIFDAHLGQLFVIRVAGNVMSPEVAGTLQYAGVHLQTPLFVVLGHEQCGAVQAALDVKLRGGKEKDRIKLLLANILPGLEGIDEHSTPENLTSLAVEANVRWSMRQILESPEGRMRVAENRYKLVGAVYEISSGRVRFL